MSGNGGSTHNLVAIEEEDVSYFKEMLSSSLNKLGLGAAVAAVIPAAIVGGPALAVFPLVAYAGGAAIAALFVPSSPVFRQRVNRRLRSERREELRGRFLSRLVDSEKRTRDLLKIQGMSLLETEIDLSEVPWTEDVESYRPQYQRMIVRLSTLNELAETKESEISSQDIERLQDSTVDFLRLVHARHNLLERIETSRSGEVEVRIADIDRQLDSASPALRSRLERARDDLQRTAEQVAQLPARDAALAAQLLHMSETFEELFHRITSDPASGSLSSFLEEATGKLSIEEELQWATDSELSELGNARKRAASRRTE